MASGTMLIRCVTGETPCQLADTQGAPLPTHLPLSLSHSRETRSIAVLVLINRWLPCLVEATLWPVHIRTPPSPPPVCVCVWVCAVYVKVLLLFS